MFLLDRVIAYLNHIINRNLYFMLNKKSKSTIIDLKKFRYWQALYRAFYSSRLYIDVAQRWKGFGGKYLLLLISLAVLPMTIRSMIDVHHHFDQNIIQPLGHFPEIHIQGGEAIVHQAMPYFIKNKQGIVAIIDTTGKISELKNFPQTLFLMTKDRLYYRMPKLRLFFNAQGLSSPAATEAIDLSSLEDQFFDGKAWLQENHLILLKWMFTAMVYPCLIMFSFSFLLVNTLFFSVIGQALAHLIFKIKITFKTTCRLMIVASTLQIATLFSAIAMSIEISRLALGCFLMTMIYFCYAILCVKRSNRRLLVPV